MSYFLDEHIGMLPEADELTWRLGEAKEDRFGLGRAWRHRIFRQYPPDIDDRGI